MSEGPGQRQGVWVTGQRGGQRAGGLSSTPTLASAVEGGGESWEDKGRTTGLSGQSEAGRRAPRDSGLQELKGGPITRAPRALPALSAMPLRLQSCSESHPRAGTVVGARDTGPLTWSGGDTQGMTVSAPGLEPRVPGSRGA